MPFEPAIIDAQTRSSRPSAATHPNLIEVALYQGVSRLFLNDIAGAKVELAVG